MTITIEEYRQAKDRGIRELLTDMVGRRFWSSSVHPNFTDVAHCFGGDYGDVTHGSRSIYNVSVRRVSRPKRKKA